MNLDWGWLQRRFWDFRQGHSLGLAFILGFVNFIVLNYSLLISNVPALSRLFPHLWMFALGFSIPYLLGSVLIGYFGFRKRQLHTDLAIASVENPFLYKAMPGKELTLSYPVMREVMLWRIDVSKKLGILTPDREKAFLDFLQVIEKLMRGGVIAK